jgi:glycogen phosphorylase
MRAVRQFNVVPAIPPRLAVLGSLANNIHWTWDRQTQALFAELDPSLWESSDHDPLRLIAGITAARWAELSADPEIVALTDAAAERLIQATTEPRWFQGRPDSPLELPTSRPSSG